MNGSRARGILIFALGLAVAALASPRAGRAEDGGATYVLVVGVNAYKDAKIPALRFAESDARAVFQFFATEKRSPTNRDRVTLLLGADATREEILAGIDSKLAKRAVRPEDTAILYFAGHGFADAGDTYIAPCDARLDRLAATAITQGMLADAWAKIRAGRKVLILDACHSGGIEGLRGIGGVALAPALTAAVRAATSVVIAAAGAAESSAEDKELGQGCFTIGLLRGLRGEADADGDGVVTDGELERFLAVEVPALAAQAGGNQTPVVKRAGADLAVVLARAAGARGTPGAGPAPAAQPTGAKSGGGGWAGEAMPQGMRRSATQGVYVHDTGKGLAIEMVYVPPGDFLYGDGKEKRTIAKGFYIGKYDTTWKEYFKFCDADGHARPDAPSWGIQENHPVVNVSALDADAFCKWAGLELPTEEQWEKAARGTDGRKFPWGNDWDGSLCNHGLGRNPWYDESDGFEYSSPVGSYPKGASPYGALDMKGNVRQWTATMESFQVSRGGSWDFDAESCRAAYRSWVAPSHRGFNLGLRPARVTTE